MICKHSNKGFRKKDVQAFFKTFLLNKKNIFSLLKTLEFFLFFTENMPLNNNRVILDNHNSCKI